MARWVPKELRTSKAITALLILTIVGNAFWEWLARPGLGQVGRVLLSVLALGSEKMRDAAYQSAALDPYPVGSLTLTSLIAWTPIAIVVMTSTRKQEKEQAALEQELQSAKQESLEMPAKMAKWVKRLRAGDASAQAEMEAALKDLNQAEDEQSAPLKAKIKNLGRLVVAARIALLVTGMYGIGSQAALSQAVLIRRVFFANVAICGPHMSKQDQDLLLSQFAAMRTRAEYAPIDSKLRDVARTSGLQLRDEELW